MNKLKVNSAESNKVLININNLYGENISTGLEELYQIPKKTYFDNVWNIKAKNIIKYDKRLNNLVTKLKIKFNVLVVSDAPIVWIINALKEMKIYSLLKNNIISGEGKYRKGLGNQFARILKIYNLKPDKCIAVGDQEKSDIIPAYNLGIRTIFVSKVQSEYADYTTLNINNIYKIITKLNI